MTELQERGVKAATRYLKAQKYRVVHRSWECKEGTADIIAYDPDETLCFIEVQTHGDVEAGLPKEDRTEANRTKFERIALRYLAGRDDIIDNEQIRFDTIGICAVAAHKALLRHHKGCFNPLVEA